MRSQGGRRYPYGGLGYALTIHQRLGAGASCRAQEYFFCRG
jgi:hypothetical protein